MGPERFLAIALLLATVKIYSATTTCETDGYYCTYTVTCTNHAGSASNPSCSGEPNVTFIMKESIVTSTLTAGFFGSTNFDARVRNFIAINNTWPVLGESTLRYYSKTKYMDLSTNFIKSIDRYAFSSLAFMTFLNLSSNVITTLHPKSFMISESPEPWLETLDLSNNLLKSITNDIFTNVPNLKTLYLQNNMIRTLYENCFEHLIYLTTLSLNNNYLTSLNKTLNTTSLDRLQRLELSYNQLQNIMIYDMNALNGLQSVNISNNNIEFVDNGCFRLSPHLYQIDLSYNSIRGSINNLMFSDNPELEYLNLYSNRITGLDGNSFKHNKLTYINLEVNQISGEIAFNTFLGLNTITKLNLAEQNISALRNYAFEDMQRLMHLNLSWNRIAEIENVTFKNSKLNILDLSHNKISELNFFNSYLLNLTELYLNNNNITFLHKNTFQNQTLLTKLDISGNNIISIEEYSLPLQNLQYFNIINNKGVGSLGSNMFSPAKFLRFLDLSNLNITSIGNSTFVDMPLLARLNVSHNAISSVAPNNFQGLNNLYYIDLSYNQLSQVEFNNTIMTSLKSVYLNNNKLTKITKIFPKPIDLLYLDMSSNQVSDLSYVDSKLLPAIQILHLSDNSIEKFNNPYTNTLTTIVDLELSSNKIKEINLSYFKALTSVDLSNNQLQIINNTFFKNIEYVESINLSRNNISDLPPGTFQTMLNLRLLNISSNLISKLRYGSLRGLQRTVVLDVSNNKIDYLDVNVFHECISLQTLIIDYNRIKALDIEKLELLTQRNLRTVSLGGNPISCHKIIRNATHMRPELSYYGVYEIEVTSIHKIYHEDNVNGIKCGEDMYNTSTARIEETSDNKSDIVDGNSSVLLVIWCSILTIVVLFGIIAVGYKKWRKRSDTGVIYRESRVQLRNSSEFSIPEF